MRSACQPWIVFGSRIRNRMRSALYSQVELARDAPAEIISKGRGVGMGCAMLMHRRVVGPHSIGLSEAVAAVHSGCLWRCLA